MPKEYHKVTPAAYLILKNGNDILLLRRFNTGWQDGSYSFIAGHVESRESPIQTIIREAHEEAGIAISPKDISMTHVLYRKEPGYERIDFFFVADVWSGTIENKEPNKCDDLSWHSIDALPDNTIPYIKHVVQCIQGNILYSEFGF